MRIARCAGRDATGAPEHDQTIAGAAIDEIERLRGERDHLLAEVERLRVDAERWQWLRQQGGWPESEAAMIAAGPLDFDRLADAGIGA